MSDDEAAKDDPKAEPSREPASEDVKDSPVKKDDPKDESSSEPTAESKPAAESRPTADSKPAAESRPAAESKATDAPKPSASAPRSPWPLRIGLLVAGLAVGGFAAWWFFVREAPLDVPQDLFAAVPARADVVARFDLRQLRRSRHVTDLLTEGDRRTGRLATIRERCGFDPVEKVDELVVFATLDARGRTEDFAYIARGDLSRAQSEACAVAVAGGQGGSLRIERYQGRIVLAANRGDGRIALLDETHAVGGGRALVHAVIDVLVKGEPSLARGAPLSGVLRRISDGQDFAGAVALSPASQRSLDGSLPEVLRSLAKARTLGVSAAFAESRWRVGVVAQMPAAAVAGEARTALDDQLARLRRNPLIGLTVLGTVLGGVRFAAEGSEAIGTASASEDQLDQMIGLWRRFGRRRPGGGGPALPGGLIPGLGGDEPPPQAPGPMRQPRVPPPGVEGVEPPTPPSGDVDENVGPRDPGAEPPPPERPPGVHSGARPAPDPAGTSDPATP